MSWSVRESRLAKKFACGRKHIPAVFRGLDVPEEIEQIALIVYGSTKNKQTIGGGRVMHLNELMKEIRSEISSKGLTSAAASENWPLLRMVQMMSYCGKLK